MKLSGAEILTNCLAEQGVEFVFGYPGASILPVYDALQGSPIRHILTVGEQGACFAAEGYARFSGRAGVTLATSGPGATNLVTGIADAYMDSVPLIAITGNVSLDKLGHDAFQEVDIFGMTLPVTKYSMIVKSAGELAHSIRKAFKIALSGRRGPVLIDIPSNVFDETADYERGTPEKPEERRIPAEHEIIAAAELIKGAKRPVIYAGGGVKAAGAAQALFEFAYKLCAPVTVSYMGLGCFNPKDPSFLGVLSNSNETAKNAIKTSDLIISVGARFNSRFNAFETIRKKKIPLLQIDVDKAEIDKNLDTELSIVGDIKCALDALTPLIPECEDEERIFPEFTEYEEYNRGAEIIKVLSELLGDGVTVTTDVGLHQVWTAHNFKFYSPDRFLTSGGLGAMGFSIGAAIGAYFAGGGKCLAITGDGSFNMNMNELMTAVKNKIPLIVAIMNNNSLGMIRKLQLERGNKQTPASSLYLNTDYVKLAEALGARGVRINETDDLKPTTTEALRGSLPVVLDFRLGINTGIKQA